MEKVGGWIGRFTVRYRWLVILFALLVAGASGIGIRSLTFSSNSRIFFSEDNPQLLAFTHLEQTYTKSENVFFTVAPKSGNVFTRDVLSAVQDLTGQAWQLPYSSRVDSITNFQYTRVEGDELTVENLVDEEAERLSAAQLDKVRTVVLNEPLLKGRLISRSGHVTGVNVNVVKPEKTGGESEEIAAAAYVLRDKMIQKYPQLGIYATGIVMFDHTFRKAAEEDIELLVPVMCCVLLLILALCLRSVLGMSATFFVIFLSALTGMGLAGWLGISINPASANAPTIILTLAVADSVHILGTMFHRMRLGDDRQQAIQQAIRINLQPVLVTSLTTAVGFLSMNFSDAPPFHDLGNIVAMGVIAALFYSIFFLPALAAVLPVKAPKHSDARSVLLFEQLAEFVIARRTAILPGTLLVILLAAAGIPRLQLDEDFIKYFSPRFDFRRATDFTNNNLTGMYMIDWDLDSGREGGINDPDYQRTLEAFAEWFRRQKHVCHVYTFTDIMQRINRDMHNNDPAYYRLPADRRLAAQYLLLYEMNLPFGLDLNDRINVNKSATRMTVSLTEAGSRDLRKLELAARNWLKEHAPPSMYTHGSGMTMMFAHLSERNVKAMLFASLLALILISLIMTAVLRNCSLGILSLLPNLAPAFIGFGVWGYFVGRVGLAVSVMLAVTLGIVVDDTVHFLAKYQHGRLRKKMSSEDAVRSAFRTVGFPMWISTVTLIGGFLVLSASGFQINAHLGGMTVITISFALLFDLFFLPVLLIQFDRSATDAEFLFCCQRKKSKNIQD
ncbi:MAG: efflux RND transporter permease subunit [Candidatus Electrothrix sp. YB6]